MVGGSGGQSLGGHRTKKEAVYAALEEYILRRKQQRILALFGSIEYEENYDYKRERMPPALPRP